MSDAAEEVQAHTVRLELVDRPGELLRALAPIADRGGNLLSIFHERGNLTPRGHIPVEVDVEATPERFEEIVEALREENINVMQAGTERYTEELVILLVGQLVNTDLSNTVERIQSATGAAVADLTLSAPAGDEGVSSARLRLAVEADSCDDALATVRAIAEEKNLRIVEPLTVGETA